MHKTAVISDDGLYRYALTRTWDPLLARVVWVMANPSVVDAERDDATIRKCIGFTQRWGYGGIEVVNLFAYRATDPAVLATVDDPVGPENRLWLQTVLGDSLNSLFVCAWGGPWREAKHPRIRFEQLAAKAERETFCLGRTALGDPRTIDHGGHLQQYTVCGKAVGYFRGHLRQDHAEAIGRPCWRCMRVT
jgi:hypothetical protein